MDLSDVARRQRRERMTRVPDGGDVPLPKTGLGRVELAFQLILQIFSWPWSKPVLSSWSSAATPSRTTDTHRVPVLGRTELITNKRAAGRPRDLSDVAVLEEAAEG